MSAWLDLRAWLGETPLEAGGLTMLQIAWRIGGAAVFGALVSTLYRVSRPPGERTPGFTHTLVLLAPLIAMVTLAVGTNVAAAFTLVGTLAIVRFRTPVRDSRDTVFVIFSVAEGMALGSFHLEVAGIGALVTAVSILLIRAASGPPPRAGEAAMVRLTVTITPADAGWRETLATIRRHLPQVEFLRSEIGGRAERLRLTLRAPARDAERLLELQQELLRQPELHAVAIEWPRVDD